MGGCPHTDISVCPLYLALHHPDLVREGLGCDDGQAQGPRGNCGVERGIKYAEREARIRWFHRDLWRDIEERYRRSVRERQRQRNREG